MVTSQVGMITVVIVWMNIILGDGRLGCEHTLEVTLLEIIFINKAKG